MWIIAGSKSGHIVRASEKALVVTKAGYGLHKLDELPAGFTVANCRDYKYVSPGKAVLLTAAEKVALAEAAAKRAAVAAAADKAAIQTASKAAALKAAAQAKVAAAKATATK